MKMVQSDGLQIVSVCEEECSFSLADAVGEVKEKL